MMRIHVNVALLPHFILVQAGRFFPSSFAILTVTLTLSNNILCPEHARVLVPP